MREKILIVAMYLFGWMMCIVNIYLVCRIFSWDFSFGVFCTTTALWIIAAALVSIKIWKD